MKKERRWLKSMIAASVDIQVALPWQRGLRRRPQSTRPLAQPAIKARAMAAR